MMHSFFYEFLGYGRVPSRCSITIISDDGEHMIFFENTGEGTSVTNATEQLATEIVNKFNYDPEDCRFFETYHFENNSSDVDEIKYIWFGSINKEGEPFSNKEIKKTWNAKSPKWSPAPPEIKELFNT